MPLAFTLTAQELADASVSVWRAFNVLTVSRATANGRIVICWSTGSRGCSYAPNEVVVIITPQEPGKPAPPPACTCAGDPLNTANRDPDCEACA